MAGQIMWGKFAVFTGVILATGWGVMKWSTPTEQQFYDALSPELKRKMDAVRAAREGSSQVKDQLASAGASDQIVWGDQLGAGGSLGGGAMKPTPPSTGRRV